MTLKDRAGQKFGRLTATARSGKTARGEIIWLCVCECGKITKVKSNHLGSGAIQSCGCLRDQSTSVRFRKHGRRHSPEYRIFSLIKNRCLNSKTPDYPDYGGRGITVCESWLSGGFERFLADMGDRPSKAHSIDRRDNNRNYSPENCRWATATEQANNARSNKFVMLNGERLGLAEAAAKLGVKYNTLYMRIRRGGGPFIQQEIGVSVDELDAA